MLPNPRDSFNVDERTPTDWRITEIGGKVPLGDIFVSDGDVVYKQNILRANQALDMGYWICIYQLMSEMEDGREADSKS